MPIYELHPNLLAHVEWGSSSYQGPCRVHHETEDAARQVAAEQFRPRWLPVAPGAFTLSESPWLNKELTISILITNHPSPYDEGQIEIPMRPLPQGHALAYPRSPIEWPGSQMVREGKRRRAAIVADEQLKRAAESDTFAQTIDRGSRSYGRDPLPPNSPPISGENSRVAWSNTQGEPVRWETGAAVQWETGEPLMWSNDEAPMWSQGKGGASQASPPGHFGFFAEAMPRAGAVGTPGEIGRRLSANRVAIRTQAAVMLVLLDEVLSPIPGRNVAKVDLWEPTDDDADALLRMLLTEIRDELRKLNAALSAPQLDSQKVSTIGVAFGHVSKGFLEQIGKVAATGVTAVTVYMLTKLLFDIGSIDAAIAAVLFNKAIGVKE